MKKKPRSKTDRILAGKKLVDLVIMGFAMAVVTLFVFNHYFQTQGKEMAVTMAFTTIIFSELMLAFFIRREGIPTVSELFTNKLLVGAIAVTLFLHFVILYTPFLATIFDVIPLDPEHFVVAFFAAVASALGAKAIDALFSRFIRLQKH